MFAIAKVKITLITITGTIGATLRRSRFRITKTAAIRPNTAVDAPAVAWFGAAST
jgi:hypothetical protein